MTERVAKWSARATAGGLLAIGYALVVLPASMLRRLRQENTLATRPDPTMPSYWVDVGATEHKTSVYSSDEMIVVLRNRSVIGGYLRSVHSLQRWRRAVPALLALILAPLRRAKTTEAPRVDPDIYAMH